MKSYGEILIFGLLLLTNLRVFVLKKTKVESLVILSPLSFLLSIFLVLSWGFDIFTVTAFGLSLIVTLTNFHALIRFRLQVFIDHYSGLMKFWAIITSILSLTALVFTIIFMPVELDNKKLGITETRYDFTGSFKSGFTEASNFSQHSMYLFEYTMFPEFKERKNVAVLVSDKRGDSIAYKPYMQLLAKEGITVVSADFFADDGRWFYKSTDSKYFRSSKLIIQSVTKPQYFNSQKEFYTYNITREINTLMPMLIERYGTDCQFFLIGDVMSNTAISDYAQSHSDIIAGTFALDSIEEYKTAGYGCVEQTNPLLAINRGTKKDRSCFITKYLVLKSKEAILEAWLKK